MSKPLEKRCAMYCNLYPTCTKTQCNRSILFINGKTKLVESHIYNYYRAKEKFRDYHESPTSSMRTF
jgi:hypothetical protein